ncbi:reverse transcriptase domain-containing protein [Tanacetum coccineum]
MSIMSHMRKFLKICLQQIIQVAIPLRFRNPRPSLLLLPPHFTSIKVSDLIWEEFEAYLVSDSFPPGNSNPSSTLPPFHNSLSGSTTSSSPSLLIFETSDYFLEEFADEPAHITFPPGNDDLPFDAESDIRELEYLLNHVPTKEIDSILEDSVDENSLDDNLDDTISKMFTNEHALDYSSPPLWDDYDDELFDLKIVNDDTYDDPFDSKEEKIKDSKILIDELDLPVALFLMCPYHFYDEVPERPEYVGKICFSHVLSRVQPGWAWKEPLDSILTWDDLVSKFINKFFPPSKTTNLQNEITRFQQRFDETFYEAWDRFNDLLRACPHHGFSELHQLDTFYNALNSNDQDSLNSAAGGNFLDKMPRDCLRTIESKSKVRNSRNKPIVAKVSSSTSTLGISPDVVELKDMVKALLLEKKNQTQAPTPVKAVEESCVTCGGAHSYRNCPATDGNVYRDNIQEFVSQAAAANFNQGNTGYRAPIANQIRPPGFPPVQNNQNNQGNNQNRYNQNRGNNYNQSQIYRPPINQPPVHQAPPYQAPAPQTQGVTKNDFESYVKANDAVMRNMQDQNQNLQNQMTNLTDMLSKFVNSNTASTSGSGILPSNTITYPKVDLKGITTRSGVAYQGPTIPTTTSSSPKVVERESEVTKDTVLPTNNESTKDVQPPVVQVQSQVPNSEPAVAPVSAPMPNSKLSIPYPSRHNDEKRHEKANDQVEKFYKIFQDMSFEISLADALILMPKFASTLKALIGNKEKLSEMARTPLNEHCSAVILNKLPEKLGDPDKFLIPCDFPGMDECLALADLGASINLMPLSVWKKLSLPELTPACMTLELADRSITKPIGIAEDVYLKVGKFKFPAEFVVVDFDSDSRVPLILGRSFLKTGRALIDVYEGELTLRVGKEAITFNLDQTSRYSSNYDDMTANRIDVSEMACEEY